MAKKRSKRSTRSKSPRRRASTPIARLPRHAHGVWGAAIGTPPAEVDRAAMYDLLVVWDETRQVRQNDLCIRPATRKQLVDAVEAAIRRPSHGVPARPARVVVDDAETAEALAPLARRAGFVVSLGSSAEFLAGLFATASATGFVLTEETALGVPPVAEPELVRAAAGFARLAPWESVDEGVVIELRPEGRPLRHPYIVVTGALGECLGYGAYPSLEAVERAREPDAARDSRLEATVLFLLGPHEIEEPVLEVAEARGYDMPSGLLPRVIQLMAGEPRELDERDAEEVILTLDALTAHFEVAIEDEVYMLGHDGPVTVQGVAVPLTVHLMADEHDLDPDSELDWDLVDGLTTVIDFPCRCALAQLEEERRAELPTHLDLPPQVKPGPHALLVWGAEAHVLHAAERSAHLAHYLVLLERDGSGDLFGYDDGGVVRITTLAPGLAGSVEALAAQGESLSVLFLVGDPDATPEEPRLEAIVGGFVVEPVESAPQTMAEPSPFEPDERFVFEVSLDDVEPRIWRRFALPHYASFHDLHGAIQIAAAWEDAHLYRFTDKKTRKAEVIAVAPAADIWDEEAEETALDADLLPLWTFFKDRRKRRCHYLYDFGDCWRVTVQLEKVVRGDGPAWEYLGGERAFPPEDSGGIGSYERLVEVAEAPDSDPEYAEWLGPWRPDAFDADAVAREFDEIARG